MLILSPTNIPSAERALASPETAPGSARTPQVTFAQVVAEVMERAQVRPPLQAAELLGAAAGTDPTTPEDETGVPGAVPDASATLQGHTAVLPAPGHGVEAGHDLSRQNDLSIVLQVVSAAGRDQSVPPRTAPPPLSAVGDSPVLAVAAPATAESRVALDLEATLSTLPPVPEDMSSPPIGPVPAGVSTSYVLPLAQPFRGKPAAPLATDSGSAAGANVSDIGFIVPPAIPTMQPSPDGPPPDAQTMSDQVAVPPWAEAMGHAIGDHGHAGHGPAHWATSPDHLLWHGAQDSALPVAAATLPGAAQVLATMDNNADPQGTQTAASRTPYALSAAFGEEDSFDGMAVLRDPVPVAGARFSPVPGRQTPEGQPMPTAPVPVQQIPLPTPGIERWIAGPPMPHAVDTQRAAVEAVSGRAARQAAAEMLAVPPPDATPGTKDKAIADTTVQPAPPIATPTELAATTMPPPAGSQTMALHPGPAVPRPAAESPVVVQATPIVAMPMVPSPMTVPPPPASQAMALQPGPAVPWPAAESLVAVQVVTPIGAMPAAFAAMAIALPQQSRSVALQPDPAAHWPVAASPLSEPALATGTSTAPLPSRSPTGIAAYVADPVGWRIQRLCAVPDRPPNPADPVPASLRDDAPLMRAMTVDQGMSGPQTTALSAAPPTVQATAQAVTRQVLDPLAQGVQRGQSGQITVHLSPVELGRVEIAMQPREAGMALIILAERPEVLDLLRRHIDLLADDMRALGYSDLSFQFGAGSDRRGAAAPGLGQNDALQDTGASPNGPQGPVTPTAQARHDGRLDLRF